jgi:hypothetical protein
MLQKIILCCSLLICVLSQGQKNSQAVPVIFDSDMGPDYDDVGAITLLHALGDSGQVRILATIASTKYNGVSLRNECVQYLFQQARVFPLRFPGVMRQL